MDRGAWQVIVAKESDIVAQRLQQLQSSAWNSYVPYQDLS